MGYLDKQITRLGPYKVLLILCFVQTLTQLGAPTSTYRAHLMECVTGLLKVSLAALLYFADNKITL